MLIRGHDTEALRGNVEWNNRSNLPSSNHTHYG